MNKLKDIGQFDPFPLYMTMRNEDAVYFDPERRNWNIFCYEDVQRVLSEYSTFSSALMGDQPASVDMPFSASMINTDPPHHRQLRNLVSQAFTPRAVEALAPRISSIVQGHLDKVMQKGYIEVIQDLAYPLPVTVIAEMMGVPEQDYDQFKLWSDTIVSMADFGENLDPSAFAANQSIIEMGMYLFNLIEQRRREPGEDLISGLLAASVDGKSLDPIELIGVCALLMIAGHETTTNLLGNAMYEFAQHPDFWKQIRNRSEFLPGAIEEILRFRSPVQSFFRVAKIDTQIGGRSIQAGDRIVTWIGSANRDESQFSNPDIIDIQRSPNRHLAFGQGIHYCLGAPLARLEAKIAFEAILERFESIQIKPGFTFERVSSTLIFGFRQIPILFTAN